MENLRQLAVIDIGSNSVRLVIYDLFGSHFTPVYNEKILAGLGRDLRTTGRLSVKGKALCRAALARFSKIIAARGLSAPLIGATAAMRQAEDAPNFVKEIKLETGLDISPISGTEEARLSALGLLSSNDRRKGLAADLGGASLEIMYVSPELRHKPSAFKGVSLPLGPFDAIGGNLSQLTSKDYHSRISDIDSYLENIPNEMSPEEQLFLIGGAWRNLASVHQHHVNYPLRTLQGYPLASNAAVELANWAYNDGLDTLLKWPGMRRARAETLPYAGLLLERLLLRFKPKSIIVSMAGLREGLVWDNLSQTVKSRDPLIDGCRDFARGFVQAEHFGTPLFKFLSPLLPYFSCGFGDGNDARLLQAACHLAGLGKNLHPDYRAELVFEDVLYAPVAGLTHSERVFLSLSLFRTYTAKRQPPGPEIIETLLNDAQRDIAASIGEAIRTAIVLTGRTPSLLSDFELLIDDGVLELKANAALEDMLTPQLIYRFEKLAKRLGLKSKLAKRD